MGKGGKKNQNSLYRLGNIIYQRSLQCKLKRQSDQWILSRLRLWKKPTFASQRPCVCVGAGSLRCRSCLNEMCSCFPRILSFKFRIQRTFNPHVTWEAARSRMFLEEGFDRWNPVVIIYLLIFRGAFLTLLGSVGARPKVVIGPGLTPQAGTPAVLYRWDPWCTGDQIRGLCLADRSLLYYIYIIKN